MIAALAEQGLFPRELVLEKIRDSSVAPTDFGMLHQILKDLKDVITPERITLSVSAYEIIGLSEGNQYLASDEQTHIEFLFEDFLNIDVGSWEYKLKNEQKYISMLLAGGNIRVSLGEYDKLLFYSRQTQYIDIEDALLDDNGFYIYHTGGSPEVSWLMITTGDPVTNPIMRITLQTHTGLIFENKYLFHLFSKALEKMRSQGWNVKNSPTISITTDSRIDDITT